MSLFSYRDKTGKIPDLTEAYKQIETIYGERLKPAPYWSRRR
jgi:hypothetical protein